MVKMQSEEYGTLSGTRKIWLLLLLLVLLVVLVIYDQGAANEYGEKAYAKAATMTEKATRWAKQIYACGLPGCKPEKAAAPPAATAPEQPNAPAPTQDAIASSPAYSAPAPGSEPAGSNAPSAPMASADASAPGAQPGSGGANYPTYPAYPPYSAFGHGSPDGMSNAPAGETPHPVAPQADAAPQPYLAPATPTTALTPSNPALGKPEVPYPAYPAYPTYPPVANASPTPPAAQQANPARPSEGLLPAPRAVRPDQRRNMAPSQAPDQEPNDGLALARKSALAGRLGESIHEYLQYLSAHPHDVNAYGELGNVYMKIGRYPEAAQNYYEAATRLIDARQMNAVASLMPIIQMHEPMLANLLNQKIARATEGARGYPR